MCSVLTMANTCLPADPIVDFGNNRKPLEFTTLNLARRGSQREKDMVTLTPTQIVILRRVHSGLQSFAPQDYSNASDPLTKFQAFAPIVADIDALYGIGAITLPRKHRERITGRRYVDHVMVHALTPCGAELLSLQPAETSEA